MNVPVNETNPSRIPFAGTIFRTVSPTRMFTIVSSIALTVVISLTATPPTSAAEVRPTASSTTAVAPRLDTIPDQLVKVFNRVNTIRAKNGLRQLKLNVCLTDEVAQPWAVRMARTGEFRHRAINSVRSACPKNGWVGENIAYGYANAKAVMKAWMHSPGHRHNILRPQFRRIGLGISTDKNGRIYWVQNFGGI